MVSQDFPATIEPSGRVTVISSRGFAIESVSQRRSSREIFAAVAYIQETSASYSDFNFSNNWILWGIYSGTGLSYEAEINQNVPWDLE